MSEALVPAVTRPPAARTGTAAMALPAVIVDAGPVAVERFLEFFAAQVANARTRAAYARAAGRFLSWCAARGLGLRAIAPLHVAAYIRTHPGSAPTVKQHLAAIRVLSDWLVIHQVLPVNPAAAVRGPKHVVTKGATPVLTPAETRSLLDGIDPGSLVGLRDRALLSVMVYSFARVSAVVGMRRQDYFLQGTRGWLRLHEKGGKRHDVPAHHRAEAAVDAYLVAGGIGPAQRAHLTAPHPRHEQQSRDHRIEPPPLESNLVGLDTPTALPRPVAGSEHGREVRDPERSRLPAPPLAGGSPVPGRSARRREPAARPASRGSTPRRPPSSRGARDGPWSAVAAASET